MASIVVEIAASKHVSRDPRRILLALLLTLALIGNVVDGEAWRLVSGPKGDNLNRRQQRAQHGSNGAKRTAPQLRPASKLGSNTARLSGSGSPKNGGFSPVTSSSCAGDQRDQNGDSRGGERGDSSVLLTLMEVRKRYQTQRQHQSDSAAGNWSAEVSNQKATPTVGMQGLSAKTTARIRERAKKKMQMTAQSPTLRTASLRPIQTAAEDCIICAETLGTKLVGRVSCNSSHFFCFDCIHRWGTTCENSCPLCKQSFSSIDKLAPAPLETVTAGRRLGDSTPAGVSAAFSQQTFSFVGKTWRVVGTVQVEEKRQRAEDEDAVDGEEGCGGCGRVGLLILCDTCDVGYCLACANLTEQTVPPEHEPWFCRECEEDEDEEGEESGVRPRRRGTRRQRAQQLARELGRGYRTRRGENGRDEALDGFVVDDEADDEQDQDWTPERVGLAGEAGAVRHEHTVAQSSDRRVYRTRSRGARASARDDDESGWSEVLRPRTGRGQTRRHGVSGGRVGGERDGEHGTSDDRAVGKRAVREAAAGDVDCRSRRRRTGGRRRRGRRRGEDSEGVDSEWVPDDEEGEADDMELDDEFSLRAAEAQVAGRRAGSDGRGDGGLLSIESEGSDTVTSTSGPETETEAELQGSSEDEVCSDDLSSSSGGL